MGQQCPYLGLQGDRYQLFLVPSPRHRCYRSGQPQRVAQVHQGETCLTSSYRRCLRLAGTVQAAHPVPEAPPTMRDFPARYPNLRAMPQETTARRPLTWTEMLVFSLVACIVLAGCSVGYGLVHRLQLGPGMRTVAAVVTAPLVKPEASPSLVPTLPPPAPYPTAVDVATDVPPTSIPEPTLPSPATVVRPPAQSPPTRLVIAKIGLDVPILPVGIRTIQEGGQSKTVWGDVPNAGGFHTTSAYPGNGGNTVINGHRDVQGSVFRHLDRLEEGDEIVLYVGEVPYAYRVTQTLVVPETFVSPAQQAENFRLIGPAPEERLTLVTCTPIGLATHRLLVIARPAEWDGAPDTTL